MQKAINLDSYQMTHDDINELIAANIVWLEGVNPSPGSPAEIVKDILDRCRVVKTENRRVIQ